MADSAFRDRAGVALQLTGGSVVVAGGNGIGPFGMRAAVAAFTEDTAVTTAETKQYLLAAGLVLGKTPIHSDNRFGVAVVGAIGLQQPDAVAGLDHIGGIREIA